MLNSAYIYEQLPVEIRPFFKIDMAEIPNQYHDALDNVAQAINVIARFAKLNKTINLLVGAFPFELSVPNAKLSVQILEPALHITLENWVFLDLNKLKQVASPIQRACVLEELAHSLMNIADEHLVKVMVAEMLPDVEYKNWQYCLL